MPVRDLDPWRGKRVGVLMGGPSAERDVSLNTGRGVHAALAERGWDAVAIDWTAGADPTRLLRDARVDVIWNALHGSFGEDGAIQGLFECLRLPYTGSGVMASALAMDKVRSKRLFEAAGLGTAPWKILADTDAAATVDDAARAWGWPVVVKPACEGSSVGVTIVHDAGESAAAVELARRYHGPVLVEKFIPGQEIDIGVLAHAALGTVEIRPAKEFYDYEAKYLRKDTQYLVPAPVSPAIEAELRRVAVAAFDALGCTGYARVDTRVDPSGAIHLLEVNTLPGMTATSLLPKLAKHAGMSYGELCETILATAGLHL
jgi:D-alanine-D-alanine ligase